MTPLPATASEIALWGRCLRSFNGATGTGYPTDEPQLAGHLFAAIPVDLATLVMFWDAAGASRENPLSAWHRFGEFEDFTICMRAQRHKKGWLGKSDWYCEFSCYLGAMEVEVRGVYLTSSPDLVGLFTHADMLMKGDRPPRAKRPV